MSVWAVRGGWWWMTFMIVLVSKMMTCVYVLTDSPTHNPLGRSSAGVTAGDRDLAGGGVERERALMVLGHECDRAAAVGFAVAVERDRRVTGQTQRDTVE